MENLKIWAVSATLAALVGTAQAALVSLEDGTVKDTTTNLIWLQDWGVGGFQNWAQQNTWAETQLDGFAGSDDWHLPSIEQFDDLFAAYGDLKSKLLPFANVQSNFYWSGTDYASDPLGAWGFYSGDAFKMGFVKSLDLYAVAVRSGNVTGSVPEPHTLALALLALGAAVGALRSGAGPRR